MSEHKFNNEYDVILWTIFLLLDRFEKEDQLFTAQCIWWLASMIQFMEILIYYRHYQIFPSDYVINYVVTPLSGSRGNKIPEGDIPESSLEEEVNPESPKGSWFWISWRKLYWAPFEDEVSAKGIEWESNQ